MDALDAVVPLVAVAAPTAVVLLDIVAYDRPRAPERAPEEPPAEAAPVADGPAETVAEPPAPVEAPVEVPVDVPAEPAAAADATADDEDVDDDAPPASMLAALTATEVDERSLWRRVRALFVVIVLTLLTAALVGAGIYRAVSRLG